MGVIVNSQYNDMGAYVKAEFGMHVAAPIVAGSGTDNLDYEIGSYDYDGYGSAAIEIAYSATIALSTLPLMATVSISESADDSTFGTYAAILTSTSIVSTTTTGLYKLDVDMTEYKRYAKFKINLDSLAAATDSIYVNFNAIKGGAVTLPIA